MMDATKVRFGRLDFLVLNASGGLEKGKQEDSLPTGQVILVGNA